MKPKFADRINMAFKYTPSGATNVRRTIERELKRLGARPVVRVEPRRS